MFEQVVSGAQIGTWHAPQFFTRGEIMPATKADLADLRAILYHLENSHVAIPERTRRQYADSVKRMLHVMEYGDPASPVWWAAGALRKAMRKTAAGRYIPTDLALQTWSLDQIFAMFPDES